MLLYWLVDTGKMEMQLNQIEIKLKYFLCLPPEHDEYNLSWKKS